MLFFFFFEGREKAWHAWNLSSSNPTLPPHTFLNPLLFVSPVTHCYFLLLSLLYEGEKNLTGSWKSFHERWEAKYVCLYFIYLRWPLLSVRSCVCVCGREVFIEIWGNNRCSFDYWSTRRVDTVSFLNAVTRIEKWWCI